jgi:hypothetical protein
MLLSVIFVYLIEVAFALVPRVPDSASSDACKTGNYAKLAALKYYLPVQSYCSKKYPNTVTVTVEKALKRRIPIEKTTTTSEWTSTTTYKPTTTPKKETTTTPKKETTTTPKKETTTTPKKETTTAPKKETTTTTTIAKCTKDALECLLSSVIGDGAKTVSHTVSYLPYTLTLLSYAGGLRQYSGLKWTCILC